MIKTLTNLFKQDKEKFVVGEESSFHFDIKETRKNFLLIKKKFSLGN